MSSTLRIILIIGSVLFFAFIVNMVRTKKLELKYALIWLLTSFSFVVMSVFPQTVFFVAEILAVEVPANALFLCIIFLLLLMVFALTVAVSRQAGRIKKLIQELGLLKAELESHSHCHSERSEESVLFTRFLLYDIINLCIKGRGSVMSRKIKQDNYGNAVLFPIAFVLFAIPMMVYMKLVKLKPIESANWQVVDEYPDFFDYFKSQWLIAAAVLAAIIFFGYTMIKALKIEYKFVYIPIGLYALLIILSTVFSEYRDVALGGFVARYEGMNTLLCYLVLMFTVINLVKSEKQVQFLIKVLMISALIIGLIGLFQLFELDLFRTDFGKRLILPKAYHGTLENVNFRFEKTYIYSTLTNPNYVGSYMVMLIPIAITAFIYVKKIWMKAGMAALTLVFIANLLGSRSRAGLAGAVVAVIFGLILLRKYIFKRKLVFFGITAAIITVFVVINVSLNGLLTNRIVSEFKIIFSDVVQFYDLQDIIFSDNKLSLVSSTETLNIIKNKNEITFHDANGNMLNIGQKSKKDTIVISFKEDNYKDYSIEIEKNLMTLNQKGTSIEFAILDEGFSLIGNRNELVNKIEKAPSIGFEGKERLGSARGYIWSRSIPLLKNSILLGYGPDTFTIKFPQEDYIGKIRAYGTARMIVDKPHNMYLQIALNTGILSLIAFLTICGAYIIDSIRLYFKNLDNSFVCLTGTGIFLGICGYLAAAVFNDSMVAIASVFWILLGLGFVCNGIVSKRQEKTIANKGQGRCKTN